MDRRRVVRRRAPAARHQYDVGLSYSTQRYDGGNLLALRDVADGSRNVGTVYGYDTLRADADGDAVVRRARTRATTT